MGLIGAFPSPEYLLEIWRLTPKHSKGSLRSHLRGKISDGDIVLDLERTVVKGGRGSEKKGGGYNITTIDSHWPRDQAERGERVKIRLGEGITVDWEWTMIFNFLSGITSTIPPQDQ